MNTLALIIGGTLVLLGYLFTRSRYSDTRRCWRKTTMQSRTKDELIQHTREGSGPDAETAMWLTTFSPAKEVIEAGEMGDVEDDDEGPGVTAKT